MWFFLKDPVRFTNININIMFNLLLMYPYQDDK